MSIGGEKRGDEMLGLITILVTVAVAWAFLGVGLWLWWRFPRWQAQSFKAEDPKARADIEDAQLRACDVDRARGV